MINWISIADSKPFSCERGDWDGKRSGLCVCQDTEGKYHLAHLYTYPNGEYEWYDQNDFGLLHAVVKWSYIDEL